MFDIRVNDVWRNTDDGTRAVVKSRERKYIIVGDDFSRDSYLKKISINSFRTFILLRRSSDILLYSDKLLMYCLYSSSLIFLTLRVFGSAGKNLCSTF